MIGRSPSGFAESAKPALLNRLSRVTGDVLGMDHAGHFRLIDTENVWSRQRRCLRDGGTLRTDANRTRHYLDEDMRSAGWVRSLAGIPKPIRATVSDPFLFASAIDAAGCIRDRL